MFDVICGYTDRPNYHPGETVDFFISCEREMDLSYRLVRLLHAGADAAHGLRELSVDNDQLAGTWRGKRQFTQRGNFIRIDDPAEALSGSAGFLIDLFIWPTLPQQDGTILSRYDTAADTGWSLETIGGHLSLMVADGRERTVITCAKPLAPEQWFAVTASLDVASGKMSLSQTYIPGSVNGRFGFVADYDGSETASVATAVRPGIAPVPVIIAGKAETGAEGEVRVVSNFNGKIEKPRIFTSAVPDGDAGQRDDRAAAAAWDFAVGIGRGGIGTDHVADVSGNGLDGACVNQPDRAMTGHNWMGIEECFTHNPEQYGAIWFHSDSLDDCRWTDPLRLTLPADIKSGAYALLVTGEGHCDRITFFVTPELGKATAKLAVLMPTCSYLSYANTQVRLSNGGTELTMASITAIEPRDVALSLSPDCGLSIYDAHVDGRGVFHSSWRRPILGLRPNYRHEFGSMWAFPADLYLVNWLEQAGYDHDIITDHDLHEHGAALLQQYRTVMSPTHAEYYSRQMLDAWETYLSTGGNGMYLGGNAFYWVTSLHPEKPWLIEVRKAEDGDGSHSARPGEYYHATTGERGGLWRNRARAPQKLWGIGMVAHSMDVSAPFVQLEDAFGVEGRWILEGLQKDELIGGFGPTGGASGEEMDAIDYALGTPPNALLLASSYGHTANAQLTPEELWAAVSATSGLNHPRVRGDIVYFPTRGGGAVFSAGSMTWCSALSHNGCNNNVATITSNVLDRFLANEVDRSLSS